MKEYHPDPRVLERFVRGVASSPELRSFQISSSDRSTTATPTTIRLRRTPASYAIVQG